MCPKRWGRIWASNSTKDRSKWVSMWETLRYAWERAKSPVLLVDGGSFGAKARWEEPRPGWESLAVVSGHHGSPGEEVSVRK